MNNAKNREGSFYASKVHLFLNEYGDDNLVSCSCETIAEQKKLKLKIENMIDEYRSKGLL